MSVVASEVTNRSLITVLIVLNTLSFFAAYKRREQEIKNQKKRALWV